MEINNFKMYEIHDCNVDDSWIFSLSIFPSGKIISVSGDKSIRIYKDNFTIFQTIKKSPYKSILSVSIRDENNFAICFQNNIEIYKTKELKENYFELYSSIINAHENRIYKIIYHLNGNLISCSEDKTIKIWEEYKYKQFQSISIFKNLKEINSILLLEDKNILVSSGGNGTFFWNFNNNEIIFKICETKVSWNNALQRIDKERIILGQKDDTIIIIISLIYKNIINTIEIGFECYGLCVIQNKKLFLVGGKNKEIKIFKTNNYECIQTIQNTQFIYGFTELKNGTIASYGLYKSIKIWSFSNNN